MNLSLIAPIGRERIMHNQFGDFTVELGEGDLSLLDLFSISPTLSGDMLCPPSQTPACIYGAPLFAYQRASMTFGVVQGSCNHWDCPRCGIMVAKQHYGRIVEGCRALAETNQLYFVTITCRGKELSEDEAMKSYLLWSSKFLDACYSKAKRAGSTWAYVQVTEKQGRGHPHSHIITTFDPGDLVEVELYDYVRDNAGKLIRTAKKRLRSDWTAKQVLRSGLGEQYDISAVRTVEGASRYVAKYMFKKSQFTDKFPPHWKRVRYSQSFPKLPKKKTDAFVLMTTDDYAKLASKARVVDCYGNAAYSGVMYGLGAFTRDEILIERHEEKRK